MINQIKVRLVNSRTVKVTLRRTNIVSKLLKFPSFNTPDPGNVEVVQTPGTSLIKVMSQDAVTRYVQTLGLDVYKLSEW